MNRPQLRKICADENIPYLRGRLEKAGVAVDYLDQNAFTPQSIAGADALLIRTRTRIASPLLENSDVRLVATATIGMDQIDIPYAESLGVTVRNSPGCNAPGVAQYVWSALLRLGFDPASQTLGVVGKGNVGRIVVEWGRRLGARVIVCDPPRARRGEEDEQYLPLEELMRQADAVTFHTPLTRDGEDPTWHLAAEQELSLLRDGAIVVNAARGGVVANDALREELRKGRLRAVVDTWEGEPRLDRELLDLVDYGTFHIAGYSRQGKERATRMIMEAVEDCFGVELDKSGLCGPYVEPEGLTSKKIIDSYDPALDTEPLREAPEEFDRLRHDYIYREEV